LKPALKWTPWTCAGLMTGLALLVGAALWTVQQRAAKFPTLPPGERQLAIFDAFAFAVSNNYIGVMPTNADARAGRDPALARALQELHGYVKTTAAPGSPPPAG
jgi:hypothetical protein